jgi:hypothetical protein
VVRGPNSPGTSRASPRRVEGLLGNFAVARPVRPPTRARPGGSDETQARGASTKEAAIVAVITIVFRACRHYLRLLYAPFHAQGASEGCPAGAPRRRGGRCHSRRERRQASSLRGACDARRHTQRELRLVAARASRPRPPGRVARDRHRPIWTSLWTGRRWVGPISVGPISVGPISVGLKRSVEQTPSSAAATDHTRSGASKPQTCALRRARLSSAAPHGGFLPRTRGDAGTAVARSGI